MLVGSVAEIRIVRRRGRKEASFAFHVRRRATVGGWVRSGRSAERQEIPKAEMTVSPLK